MAHVVESDECERRDFCAVQLVGTYRLSWKESLLNSSRRASNSSVQGGLETKDLRDLNEFIIAQRLILLRIYSRASTSICSGAVR